LQNTSRGANIKYTSSVPDIITSNLNYTAPFAYIKLTYMQFPISMLWEYF